MTSLNARFSADAGTVVPVPFTVTVLVPIKFPRASYAASSMVFTPGRMGTFTLHPVAVVQVIGSAAPLETSRISATSTQPTPWITVELLAVDVPLAVVMPSY